MIVKMTADLQEQYDKLFEEISQKVLDLGGTTEAEVNSLPTYYRALDFIAQSGEGANNKHFFRIPLDEKPITIDLSTRKIDINNSAYKNSIGVKGDSNAEIVFFESDRFYDVTDLAACNYILIQWSNDGGATYHQEYGILQDFTEGERDENGKVIDAKTAKVLFGWLVNKEVTAKSGKVRFNVRYCITNEKNEVIFDLNTEPVDANIIGSLSPEFEADVPTKPDSAEGLVFSRPIYGSVINSMEGATPIISKNLESGIYHLNKQYPNTDGTYTMEVQASSPDNGEIIHEWYRSGSIIYDDEGNKWGASIYPADKAGSYWVRIGNKTKNGTRNLLSPTVHIPAAGKIELVNQVVPVRAYSPTDTSDSLQVPESMIANMSVKIANEDIEKLGYPAVLQYQWYKNISDTEYNALLLSDPDKAALAVIIKDVKYMPIEGADKNTYTPEKNAEGFYFCRSINHLNNTQSDPVDTSVGIVRAYPQNLTAPKIQLNGYELECILQGNVPADLSEIRYQWNRNDIGDVPARAGGTGNKYDLKAYLLEPKDYILKCFVAHEVFAGTPMAAISDRYESASNEIRIRVTKEADGSLKYTQV